MKKLIIGLGIFCLLVLISFNYFEEKVDFNTEIRPILNAKCMSCHGGVRQEAGLSFLHREAALDSLPSGAHAIVPGSAKKSKLIELVQSDDPDMMMPPLGDALSEGEVKLLKRWINQGAEWEDHWAYIPVDPELSPPSIRSEWPTNPIDQFVLETLLDRGFEPSPVADKSVVLRRVSFDLIGLPPDEQLANQFLNDTSETAYEVLVDSLLQSPHFGERWAAMWLDLARYADSKGYQKDNLRKTIWLYRDWVIDAFNSDMPFDQFTVKQLAGDLLPKPSEQDYLATAFHRNTMTNDEGGTDDEEYRVAAVLDRVSTTYEVWLATSMACVQCHSHPYDPIDHEEFYESYAVFNTTKDADDGRDSPKKFLLSAPQRRFKTKIKHELDYLKSIGDTLTDSYREKLSMIANVLPLSVPIMEELEKTPDRASHIFERGNWLVKGDSVSANLPGKLNQFTEHTISNRLDFAQWVASPNNPLTSRVFVNRLWEQLFGNGLVETIEDLGTQGAKPSHPELLDWLALQFSTDMNWSIKSLLKEIVMSSTYRQSSHVSKELIEEDPSNKWLARGPRVRLSAEQIRDQAMVIGGLFDPKLYGPSVMPYQPEGVWNTIRHVAKWETSQEGDQYRRGLYTFWRRVSPYPSMIAFDTPSRELCVSRRVRTNTPIQALITLNDPVYVEAAQSLARISIHAGTDLSTQIETAYEKALFKRPDDKVMESLLSLYANTASKYRKEGIQDEHELHRKSMENVASVIFNLDEFIMKS